MDQTHQYDGDVLVELYGGPLDGMSHPVPQKYLSNLGVIKIIRPCNWMELEKLRAELGIQLPEGTSCQYFYALRSTDNRFIFRTYSLQ